MFKWIASLFTTPEPDRPYVIYVRGIEVARSTDKAEAERWIRETFNNTDDNHVGGRGFGTNCNTSKNFRWKQFRGQCKIKKMCETCGYPDGYCGQC